MRTQYVMWCCCVVVWCGVVWCGVVVWCVCMYVMWWCGVVCVSPLPSPRVAVKTSLSSKKSAFYRPVSFVTGDCSHYRVVLLSRYICQVFNCALSLALDLSPCHWPDDHLIKKHHRHHHPGWAPQLHTRQWLSSDSSEGPIVKNHWNMYVTTTVTTTSVTTSFQFSSAENPSKKPRTVLCWYLDGVESVKSLFVKVMVREGG